MPDVVGYMGSHRPPESNGGMGAPFHAAGSVMPDVYGPQGERFYDHHAFEPGRRIPYAESPSAETFRQLRAAQGESGYMVRIYRAVPDVAHGINAGDWVTPSRKYAERHAIQDDDPGNDWPVIVGLARASELWAQGDDVNEWGYWPGS